MLGIWNVIFYIIFEKNNLVIFLLFQNIFILLSRIPFNALDILK